MSARASCARSRSRCSRRCCCGTCRSAASLLYPFKLLATWLHELSHGLAMIATGAGFDRVLIYRDTSGLAYATTRATARSAARVIAAAGYMGTPLWGAVLLVATPTRARARASRCSCSRRCWSLTAMLVVAPTPTTTRSGSARSARSRGAIARVRDRAAGALRACSVAHFIAAQACVNALLDIRVLLRAVAGRRRRESSAGACSDAHNMALDTFGTTDDVGGVDVGDAVARVVAAGAVRRAALGRGGALSGPRRARP